MVIKPPRIIPPGVLLPTCPGGFRRGGVLFGGHYYRHGPMKNPIETLYTKKKNARKYPYICQKCPKTPFWGHFRKEVHFQMFLCTFLNIFLKIMMFFCLSFSRKTENTHFPFQHFAPGGTLFGTKLFPPGGYYLGGYYLGLGLFLRDFTSLNKIIKPDKIYKNAQNGENLQW